MSTPKLKGLGMPEWWHQHGSKLHVKEYSPPHLSLQASAAFLSIDPLPNSKKNGWLIKWRIKFSAECFVEGVTYMDKENLRAAFGLSNTSGEFGQAIIDQFGGDVANQGQYIRWRNFLNIPCPGIGHDGDPNISIWLDEEIRQAVRQLLIDR